MSKTGIRPYETKTHGTRWMAYYRKDGRQFFKRGFRTAGKAERWRAEQLISKESPEDSAITVGEWMTEWLHRHRWQIKPATYIQYEASIRNWIVPHLGMIRLVRLSHKHIEAMHQEAIRSLKPSSVRRNHAPLNVALNIAERDGLIPSNPAKVVQLPPEEHYEIKPFSSDELGVFLGANIGNPLYSIYHLAAYSGLRQGEILALRVGRDIDIEHQVITVRETTGFRGTGTPKSRRSRRRVGIGPTAAAVLADAIKGIADGDLAFPYDQHVVSKSMGQACSVASLPYRRFHDLRHTYATLLLTMGENLHEVSYTLGHSDPGFTLRTYAHLLPGRDRALADATEQF